MYFFLLAYCTCCDLCSNWSFHRPNFTFHFNLVGIRVVNVTLEPLEALLATSLHGKN